MGLERMSQRLTNKTEFTGPALAAGSLERFGQIAEAVAATSKKLEKAALLGSYFKALNDADLARAARYLAGHQFALNDSRTTNVGGSIISEALTQATGFSIEDLLPRYVRLGDAGEAAYELLKETKRDYQAPALTLTDIESLITRLSETRGTKNKTGLLAALLRQATPLEAKYLVKLLVSDLRIGLKEGLVEDAIARAFGLPLADVSHANMLLGDLGEAAVRARANDLKEIGMRLFHPLKFMLATPAADFEITHRFPELVQPLMKLSSDAIIDGEIVPARDDLILPFSQLQKRLGRKSVGQELLKEVPVILVAYDLLYAAGRVLINESLDSRRKALERLIPTHGIVRVSQAKRFQVAAALDDEFAAARVRGNEGLMIKSPASLYKPGRRGREWLKLKRAIATLDVVVTAVEVGHGKRRNLLSDFTFAVRRSEEDGELLNIGKAYSGLTDAELTDLTAWFRAHTIREFAHGRVRLVEPEIVIEVTCDRIQESKRHKSGYALRFPRILRLRPDKTAAEIDTLQIVQKLVEKS